MAVPTLFFRSVNPNASRTLLLIHGAFSSHHEWDLVCQTLEQSSYHLLIPDLPGHGRSTSSTIPFSLEDTAALLADLITKHAKDGKADVAGMSLGGYTAIAMAQKYPNIIGEAGLFVSGCARPWPARDTFLGWGSGLMLFLTGWISTHLPRSWWLWICNKVGLKVVDELYLDMRAASSYRLGQAVVNNLAEDKSIKEKNWEGLCELTTARTCIVAGANGDSVQDTEIKGRCLIKGNPESRAFKVDGKVHAWDLQDPELFARGIRAWMEREELPQEYIRLS
ncbi:alpha/beta-hydrolase [Acephala macrosclerotiorum]|nr:alpha/beta-hydrolase [Acephala macrosclerotiorum]